MTGGAEKQRLYRERRRDGVKVISIEVNYEITDHLVAAGYLSECQDEDREWIAEALETYLLCTLG